MFEILVSYMITKNKDIYQESIELHKKLSGKLEIKSKIEIKDKHDLALAYTPGVAEPCREIAKDKSKVYDYTIKKNSVAIVSDGSAVLGLGNIGAEASIPVMEGKAILFKEYGGVDAFPICLKTQDTQEIINIVKNISPVFGGINLEDISAPRCFEIEEALQEIGIPVFHDDQHGTAIVVLAGLINASKIANKKLSDLKVVVSGAGAAGTAITKLLLCHGQEKNACTSVKEIIVCDSKGIISKDREDLKNNKYKQELIKITNKNNLSGLLKNALKDADVFIGVSAPNVLKKEMIQIMNNKPIVFAMANPVPEIMPDKAKEAGVFIIATGRSDFPNQVNNVLVFPGLFRGALDAGAKQITNKMKIAAAYELSKCVADSELNTENILPSVLDKEVTKKIALAISKAVKKE